MNQIIMRQAAVDAEILHHTVVRRSEWFRGRMMQTTRMPSSLLTPNGKRCCLGFTAAQCGIPDAKLEGLLYPYYLTRAPYIGGPVLYQRWGLPKALQMLISRYGDMNSFTAAHLGSMNDTYCYDTDAQREADIKAEGRRIGIIFHFID